jgi:hypothetical protein
VSRAFFDTSQSHLHITIYRIAGFLPKDRNWQHEDASELMFDDMMKEYNLDIPTQDVEFIKALIAGDGARCRSVLKSMRFELRQAQA